MGATGMALRGLWRCVRFDYSALSSHVTLTTKTYKPKDNQESKSKDKKIEKKELVAPKHEVMRFVFECMVKAGTNCEDADTVAHHLMTADYRGHFSHGMNRLKMYVSDIKNKLTDPCAKPKTIRDFHAIAVVDGCNSLGHVVGKYCMEMAICKARIHGIGLVSARGSNHYGICGYYTLMAVHQNMIGFSCTNSSPLMAPTRSKKSALGSNPLSLAMGAGQCDQFVLDMATTTVALGKIELAQRKGKPIPEGWAMDESGAITTKPEDALKSYTLIPLGGSESNSGYKGYGLALMVEVLCGVLSGSEYGPNIRKWKDAKSVANLGQCFMAIDPSVFVFGANDRLAHLLHQMRILPTTESDPVLIPGDPERIAMEKVDADGGIIYHQNQIKTSAEFAKKMDVEPMKLVEKRCH